MLLFVGSQRARHDSATKQQQNSLLNTSLCSSDMTGEEDGCAEVQ